VRNKPARFAGRSCLGVTFRIGRSPTVRGSFGT
jgi:hypothetical protein